MVDNSPQKIQVVYASGTFGNLLRWMLDRFSPNTKFKHIDNPWDTHDRVHPPMHKKLYNNRFLRGHQVEGRDYSPNYSAKLVIINYKPEDLLFVERCGFYRRPGMETDQSRYNCVIKKADKKFLLETFGQYRVCKSLAKELYKIQFHDHENHVWWRSMEKLIQDNNHYQFPIDALQNTKQFITEIEAISSRLSLGLVVDEEVVSAIVKKINQSYPVITRQRAHDVLQAINENVNIDCSKMDIVEQAWLETVLEKKHNSIIFPYGSNWFKDTNQINEFLDTYPSYLKHINPRLPWHNNNRNPFYLTGKIDGPKL